MIKIKKNVAAIVLLFFSAVYLSSCSNEDGPIVVDPPVLVELSRIEIKSLPKKLIYYQGEQLSIDGLVVEGIYSDNSAKQLEIYADNIKGFSSEIITDNLDLTVIYQKFTANFSIKVIEKKPEPQPLELVAINIKSLPSKLVYTLGESLSLDGLAIEGVFNDNSTDMLDLSKFTFNGFDSSKAEDSQIVYPEINGLRSEFAISVLGIKVENNVVIYVDPSITTLILPDYIKSIGDRIFQGSQITNLTLNNGIESIGEYAFLDSKLAQINFPASLKTLGGGAFYRCVNLTNVDMSNTNMQKISNECFALSRNLSVVKFPIGLQEIEYQAFLCSESLSTMIIPDGVRVIGNEAFRDSGISNLKLPNSVCAMAQRAFFECVNLEVVETYGDIIENNQSIELCTMQASTFEKCEKLTAFAIPHGVKNVKQNTITKSVKLTQLTLPYTLEMIDFGAFQNSSIMNVIVESTTPPKAGTVYGAWQAFPLDLVSITVPAGTSAAYKAVEGWSSYASKITE